jgi:EpsI family protein
MTRRLLALLGVLIVGAAAIRSAAVVEAVPIRRPLAELPAALGPWRSIGDVRLDRETLDILRADDYVNRTYVDGSIPANLFVAYYMTQRQGDTMHSPLNCLPGNGWDPVSMAQIRISAGDGAFVSSNRYVIQKGLDRELVLYWFQSHGRTVASEYASKVYLVLDSLRLHRSDAALVRIVVPMMTTAASAAEAVGIEFVRSVYPALAKHIPT